MTGLLLAFAYWLGVLLAAGGAVLLGTFMWFWLFDDDRTKPRRARDEHTTQLTLYPTTRRDVVATPTTKASQPCEPTGWRNPRRRDLHESHR